MSTRASRSITLEFTGDFELQAQLDASDNESSPADVDVINLALGANTITPPSNAKGCTIMFPTSNTIAVTLKGVSGDTGIVLHKTDPTSFGLNTSADTFVLTAAADITGVRIYWS